MFRSSKLFLLFAFVASFAFVGCQSSEPNEGILIDEVPTDRRIGVITSLGGIPSTSSGTHILKLDNGETILLKSLSINLDDDKYKSEAVEVRGILTYTKGDKTLMEVMNIDILENYVIEDTTAPEWKSYVSTLFSIRYRDDFELEKSVDDVSFTKSIEPEESGEATQESEDIEPLVDVVSIITTPKEEDQDLVSFLQLEGSDSADLLAEGLTRSKVGPLNLEALKRSQDNSLTFYVEGDLHFYTIHFLQSDHPDALKYENVFYEMIATFELTSGAPKVEDDALGSRTLDLDFEEDNGEILEGLEESSLEEVTLEPVTGFETFESDSIGFSVEYPKSWYFEGTNSSESGVSQVYSFSDEAFDEGGETVVTMSIATSDTSSSEVSAGGTTFGKSTTGHEVEITYRGDGRFFRFKGPKSMESTLLNMAASVSE